MAGAATMLQMRTTGRLVVALNAAYLCWQGLPPLLSVPTSESVDTDAKHVLKHGPYLLWTRTDRNRCL